MPGDTERQKPIGVLRVNVVWKHHATCFERVYYHPLEIQKIRDQLNRQGIEILRRWAMEDGELTPKQAKAWPRSVLRVSAFRNNWYNRLKNWCKNVILWWKVFYSCLKK